MLAMRKQEINGHIRRYNPDIRGAASWYAKLWSRERYYDIDDLISAGQKAVWNICEKRPEKIENRGMFGEMKRLSPNLPPGVRELNLVRQGEGGGVLLDMLPVYDGRGEELEDLEEICYQVTHELSRKDADSLKRLLDRCSGAFNVNLVQPPSTQLKEKTKVVTGMNLSDEEMVMYANVLLGAVETFPRNYVVGKQERGRKYIQFLLRHLNMSPEDFAFSREKQKILKAYNLDSFYQRNYKGSLIDLFADVFPHIEPYMIVGNRWRGREGLINAYNAIDHVRRQTGKKPGEMTQVDFRKNKFGGLLRMLFEGSHKKAIEFRYPGTYPELSKRVKKLSKKFAQAD